MRTETNLPNRWAEKRKYDPVTRAREVARIVCRDDLRKYYRFRMARFYGGIATADCVGCGLRCIFCWSWREVVSPKLYGRLYSPEEVAKKLTSIARKKGFNVLRISGNEPTLARGHLLKVLQLIPRDIQFILETNGILLGHDTTYAEDLAPFENLSVRISLKGTTEEQFSALTGAERAGFALQLQALENLSRVGVAVHPAAMVSFSPEENILALQNRLRGIDPSFEDMEIEEVVLYDDVETRLQKAGLVFKTAYHPQNIAPEQV